VSITVCCLHPYDIYKLCNALGFGEHATLAMVPASALYFIYNRWCHWCHCTSCHVSQVFVVLTNNEVVGRPLDPSDEPAPAAAAAAASTGGGAAGGNDTANGNVVVVKPEPGTEAGSSSAAAGGSGAATAAAGAGAAAGSSSGNPQLPLSFAHLAEPGDYECKWHGAYIHAFERNCIYYVFAVKRQWASMCVNIAVHLPCNAKVLFQARRQMLDVCGN
jgi:hypothetical protein